MCSLSWTHYWWQQFMGPRTARVLKVERKVELRVQPKLED